MQESSFRVAARMEKRAQKSQPARYFASNGITSDSIESRPFSATDAVPGTQEKIRVLVERIEKGLPLWHPADRSTDVLPLDTKVEANHSDSTHRPTGPDATGPHDAMPRDKSP